MYSLQLSWRKPHPVRKIQTPNPKPHIPNPKLSKPKTPSVNLQKPETLNLNLQKCM